MCAFGIVLCLFVSPLIAASPLSYVHLSLEASVYLPPAALFSHLQSKFAFVLYMSTIFPFIAMSLKLSLNQKYFCEHCLQKVEKSKERKS